MKASELVEQLNRDVVIEILDELEDDIHDKESADAQRQQIIAAGREIERTIRMLQDTTITKQDIKYLVVIEGQASADGYHLNDYFNNDVLSYQRALELHRFWKENADIDFSKMAKCELVISGSGEGGIPRFSEEDYRTRIQTGHLDAPIAKSEWEKYNQRFLIHIVPVIGNIKMDN